MESHIESRQRKSRAAAESRSLELERAFVVQFRTDPAVSRRRLQGRVEHVVSGEVSRFRSTAELLDFVTRMLAALNEGAEVPPKGAPA